MDKTNINYYKLTIAYLGTNYHGWQRQNNAKTIEGELLKACSCLFDNYDVKGASRTDAGVHAECQVAMVTATTNMTEERLVYALNAHLPIDIKVQSAQLTDDSFHPRFCAKRKTYSYKIYNAKFPMPQWNEIAYYYHKTLDIDQMKGAAPYFLGRHDFFAFSSDGGNVKDYIREIYSLEVVKKGNAIEIIVCGNGFLYNMVRIIVGTLIDVGLGKKNPSQITDIILSKDRSKSGKKAPASGLTLKNIEY